MAIKNTDLGGTDWANGEVLSHTDLNDTFDAGSTKIKSLSAFWLDSDFYDVYEDFNSYGAGAFTTNSDWTITVANSGTATIVASTNAGGTTNELRLTLPGSDNSAGTATASTKNLVANKHFFARLYYVGVSNHNIGSCTCSISLDGSAYYTAFSGSIDDHGSTTAFSMLLVVAKGSGLYDIYVGGKKLASNANPGTMQLYFRVTRGTESGAMNVYIDDVRQSKEGI